MPKGPVPRDFSGMKIGKLSVVGFSHRVGVKRYFRCICECGREVIAHTARFRRTAMPSCRHCVSKGTKRHLTHGLSHTPEWKHWCNMRKRCENPNDQAYNRYGGRGIRVCDRWSDFGNFYADMGPRPSAKHSIDRVDNDGHYEPGNCRWATPKDQANNRRSSRILSIGGEQLTLSQVADKHGLTIKQLWARLNQGWTIERAISEPIKDYAPGKPRVH